MKKAVFQKLSVVIILVLLGCSENSSDESHLGLWEFSVKSMSTGDLEGVMSLSKTNKWVSGYL